jgi:hypothetical protein
MSSRDEPLIAGPTAPSSFGSMLWHAMHVPMYACRPLVTAGSVSGFAGGHAAASAVSAASAANAQRERDMIGFTFLTK